MSIEVEVIYICDGCGKRKADISELAGWRNHSPINAPRKYRQLSSCSRPCVEKVLKMLDEDEHPSPPPPRPLSGPHS